MKVKNDHRSKCSNLSNCKEEAWKKKKKKIRASTGFESRWSPDFFYFSIYFILFSFLFILFIYLFFFQASSFQLLELENLLRSSFFTFGSNFGWLIQQMSINQKSGRRRFAAEGLYQALFSFRLARQNAIYKAKRKLNLISGYIISIRKGNKVNLSNACPPKVIWGFSSAN